MSKTTNKFSSEVRERAVRMVNEHCADYGSEWAAMTSIAGKIGCTAETLRRWCREEASRRTGPAAQTASDKERLKLLEREVKELRWAASATAMTTLWPRPSTVSTRPKSSGGSDPGRAHRPWKWQPCAGSTGSTITACSAPSGTSHPQRPKLTTMQPKRPSIWLHDSNETASGKPGALQVDNLDVL